MKALVLGSGGREHALVWKLHQSKTVDKIYCIPGNGGISQLAECKDIPLYDLKLLSDFVKENKIDFTIVGPEMPLVTGVAEHFKSKGLRIFGPDSKCARLEGSKIFSKNFMKKYGMPTAEFEVFDDYRKAESYISHISHLLVVKADGSAPVKGLMSAIRRKKPKKRLKKCL